MMILVVTGMIQLILVNFTKISEQFSTSLSSDLSKPWFSFHVKFDAKLILQGDTRLSKYLRADGMRQKFGGFQF